MTFGIDLVNYHLPLPEVEPFFAEAHTLSALSAGMMSAI